MYKHCNLIRYQINYSVVFVCAVFFYCLFDLKLFNSRNHEFLVMVLHSQPKPFLIPLIKDVEPTET